MLQDIKIDDRLLCWYWIIFIVIFTLLAAGVNAITLMMDPPYPALSLFMLPIVIVTFIFQKKGLYFSVIFAFLLSLVIWSYSPRLFLELRIVENMVILLGVALIVTLMSTALHRSENIYRLLFETSPAPVIVLKPDGTIVDVNSRFFSIFGYNREFLEGKKVQHLPIIPEECLIEIGERITSPKSFEDSGEYNIRVVDESGETHICSVISSYLHEGKGIPRSSIMVLTDITKGVIAEEKIKNSLEEKETLLKEIHHRVKNNLQEVVSILKLERLRTQDEDVRGSLKECQNRVYTMALVHESIYRSDNLSGIRLSDYLEKLARNLLIEYMPSGQKVSHEIDCSRDIEFNIDFIMPIALITNELVSNSLKYAFKDRDKGTITISVKKTGGDNYEYRYTDDGVGLPPGFRIEGTNTLGLKLVKAFVHQLDGEMEFNSSDDGINVIINFVPKE